MVNQHTVYAATEAEILSLLAKHKIMDGGGRVITARSTPSLPANITNAIAQALTA